MTPEPTGLLFGRDLVLTRTFRVGIDDVWASVTEPERTARWIGPWSGEAAPGRTVRLELSAEEGAPACDVRIEACDAPRHLHVSMVDAHGTWNLEVHLTERDGTTELRLTHHLDETAEPGSTGPGWEFYLDRLAAARDGAAEPAWEDYYPAQRAYYERLEG